MQEIVIHKHWFGALVIGLAGGSVVVGLIYLSYAFPATDQVQWLLIFAAVMVGLFTIVTLVVYSLNRITLNASGIQYTKYNALFHSVVTEADWNTVQRIDVRQGGIFASLLGYGDLMVLTADATPNLGMAYTPTVLAWKQYIDDRATLGEVR